MLVSGAFQNYHTQVNKILLDLAIRQLENPLYEIVIGGTSAPEIWQVWFCKSEKLWDITTVEYSSLRFELAYWSAEVEVPNSH